MTQKLTPTGRPSKRGDYFGFRLHDDDAAQLRAEAARRRVPTSALIREGLMQSLSRPSPTHDQTDVA